MKKFYKSLTLFLAVMVLCGVFSVGISAATKPSVSAAAAVVLDADTGTYYYLKNADARRAPASMTKLMSAYVIFEDIDAGKISPNSKVTVSSHGAAVASTGGLSNVPLAKGETYTVDTMLKLMLLPSACGACSVMADYISGSESAFATRMTSVAKSLGMNAKFINSYGANASPSSHYVTARSMAILGSAFIRNHPDILKYTSLSSVTFKGKRYKNTNHYIGGSDSYAGVDGMKTGTNNEAGSCITVSAKQNGRRIIVVVMGSGDRYGDARKLLNYGFASVKEADTVAARSTVTVTAGRTPLRHGADVTVKATVSGVTNPFMASGVWTVNGKTVATVPYGKISNGASYSCNIDLRPYGGASKAEIAFTLKFPGGTSKKTAKTFAFGSEAPCAFRDVDGHWAEPAITALKEMGVLTGCPDGRFLPNQKVTRAEFATALCRYLEKLGGFALTEHPSGFSDTKGHWADPYIGALYDLSIVEGVGGGRFAPDAPVTRQEIASMLSRAFGYTTSLTQTTFSDDKDIADWAKASVAACMERGIVKGCPDGRFLPKNPATRGEMAQMLSLAKPDALPGSELSADDASVEAVFDDALPETEAVLSEE